MLRSDHIQKYQHFTPIASELRTQIYFPQPSHLHLKSAACFTPILMFHHLLLSLEIVLHAK